MASISVDTAGVELFEPEISKPQPLRIIKRSQTITSCTSPGKIVRRGRKSSGSTTTSKGSPTSAFDGPLTIRKKRGGRSSIMTESLNDFEDDLGSGSALGDLIREQRQQILERKDIEDDPDITPKATRGMARTISAGAFLRSELHQRSSEIDATRYSVRGDRSNFRSQDQFENLRPTSPKKGSPMIPERRLSKSKNFFLRALAGQAHSTLRKEQPKSIRLVDSKESKNTLVRRPPRGRSSQSSSDKSYSKPTSSSFSRSSYFYEPPSTDIADIEVNSRWPSSYEGSTQTSLSRSSSVTSKLDFQNDDIFVLSPQIIITPEVSSVDTKNCHIWVAIEIKGHLQKAVGEWDDPKQHSQLIDSQLLDLRRYGKLYSMRITLDLGASCILSDLVGDLNEARTLRAGETHLFLAKVNFSTALPRRHAREVSSSDLMTELQHDLGETFMKYITVRINYKHSAFTSHIDRRLDADGTTSHTTRLFTEATAVIRRHNSQSAWSPRTSQTINQSLFNNPLVTLIQNLLPVEEARDVIRKMSTERPSIPPTRRFAAVTASSEETVKPSESKDINGANCAINTSLISPATVAEPSGTFVRLATTHLPYETQDDIDPARKIWTEMRRHSRSNHHPRKSISADHYFSLDDEPCRSSSADSAKTDTEIDKEREKIMEAALRNKRSLGQETLRSMAPSLDHKGNTPQPKTGTMGGLGLGTGNRWWGHPWW